MKIQEISLEISSMVGILDCLSLADQSPLTAKDLLRLLDGYINLNLEARETVGPLIQKFLK